MADDDDEGGIGEGSASPVDNLAATIALGSPPKTEGEAAKAEAYLEAQTRLLDLQAEHLHEQRELVLSRLRWGRFSDQLKAFLQAMTALAVAGIVFAVVSMIWSASTSNDLLIEKFSVPPDLVQRGLTGEVLAAKMLDRLVAMQTQTNPARPAKSYGENWRQDTVKLDIPDTGVQLSDLNAFLHGFFGKDIHVSGEVVRAGDELSLTARTPDGALTVTGSQASLDALVQKASEAVYRLTQPYRYASWLASHKRPGEALPIFRSLALSGPPQERPWGYFGWGSIAMETDGVGALRLLKKAAALEPDNVLLLRYMAGIEYLNGMLEASLHDYQQMLALTSRGETGAAEVNANSEHAFARAGFLSLTGDFQAAAGIDALDSDVARRMLGAHDVAGARAFISQATNLSTAEIPGAIAVDIANARISFDIETENWKDALAQAAALAPIVRAQPGLRSFLPAIIMPLVAETKARQGDMAGAQAAIDGTPFECDICLRVRAHIATLRGGDGADWFARAVRAAPSIPFAYADWGRALLARGNAEAAIDLFRQAIQRGPHYADPKEMWGEALMLENRSDLALPRFADAARDAPNWGRLHLKWAEALGYAGKAAEARTQLARASQLYLTTAERRELASLRL